MRQNYFFLCSLHKSWLCIPIIWVSNLLGRHGHPDSYINVYPQLALSLHSWTPRHYVSFYGLQSSCRHGHPDSWLNAYVQSCPHIHVCTDSMYLSIIDSLLTGMDTQTVEIMSMYSPYPKSMDTQTRHCTYVQLKNKCICTAYIHTSMDTQTLYCMCLITIDSHPGRHGHPDSWLNAYIQPCPFIHGQTDTMYLSIIESLIDMDTQTIKTICIYTFHTPTGPHPWTPRHSLHCTTLHYWLLYWQAWTTRQ